MSLHVLPVTQLRIYRDACQSGNKYVVEQYSQGVDEPARFVAINMEQLLLRIRISFSETDVEAAKQWIELMKKVESEVKG